MKPMKLVATLAIVSLAVSAPAFAGHEHGYFSRMSVNPGYNGNYSNHAYSAQQHAFNAQQHARMDAIYASPKHARNAWRHAMKDSHHAAHDLYGY